MKNKDKTKNDNLIHFAVATIGGTIGFIKGNESAERMCGPTSSDKVAYKITMGFMGAAVGYATFITFPVLVPLGLITAVLIEKLDNNNSKKDK